MKRTLISVFCSLFVCLLICVSMISAGAVSVYDENGGYYEAYEEKAELASENDLIPLDAPTNVWWDTEIKGRVYWDSVENCEGEYHITVYRNDTVIYETFLSQFYDNDGDGVIRNTVDSELFNQSGNYSVSIYAVGGNTSYSDSNATFSDVYQFICPEDKLPAPTNVKISSAGVISFCPQENINHYGFYVYDQAGAEIGWCRTYIIRPIDGICQFDISWYIKILAAQPGRSQMFFAVYADTDDIEKYLSSDISEKSNAYFIDRTTVPVNNQLTSSIKDIQDGNATATEALDSLLDVMADEKITNSDLAISMQSSDELVGNLSSLEQAYIEETGTQVSISDDSEDSSYLKERGILVDDITIVGAALNSDDGKDVKLAFSEADESLSADKLFYKNSVAVNISMDGVTDNQNLKVPVQIKMPVPKNVIASRLIIVHHHIDGSSETIHPKIIYENNVAYAVFTLTSFSDFVFCNEYPEIKDVIMNILRISNDSDASACDMNGDGDVTLYDLNLLMKAISEFNR